MSLLGPPEHARAVQAQARRIAAAYGEQRVGGLEPGVRPAPGVRGGPGASAAIDDLPRGARVILRAFAPEDVERLRADVEAGSVELERRCRAEGDRAGRARDHRPW